MYLNFQNPARTERASGVQSIERAFELLELMAEADGEIPLSALAEASELPLPTVHRIMRTLVNSGYVRQPLKNGRYALGPRLIRLGEKAGQNLGAWGLPYLEYLSDKIGETTNLAVLDADQMVYVAHVPSRHSMRMFTEVGRRVDMHCTAVGKVVLAEMPDEAIDQMLARTRMRPQTGKSIVSRPRLLAEIKAIRANGFALDDGEQELGVKCLAVAVPDAPTPSAISISGPEARMDRLAIREVILFVQDIATQLGDVLNNRPPEMCW